MLKVYLFTDLSLKSFWSYADVFKNFRQEHKQADKKNDCEALPDYSHTDILLMK